MKILITGATNGMGKGVATILAESDNHTHEIIILCRSKERGEATIKELEAVTKNKMISIVLCDLTKLSDVRKAIKEIHEKHEFLDGLFVNAGLGYAAQRVETEDGMDPHFQVNYLSQFMLTLNILDLLEKSETGGRVIFNVTAGGDMQMKKKWGYERGIHQAMIAKRMFYVRLHEVYRKIRGSKVSFFGFEISKTVWTNQINIIPSSMKAMAKMAKLFGTFISIEKCGMIMAPLFLETQEESLQRSGKFLTWKKNQFTEKQQDNVVFDKEMQDKLWNISLDLCKDEKTTQIAKKYISYLKN
jgi:NAD(P)-dependent dehydrogenase (short-subunit alcohol dehydrogenase family)